MTEYKPNKLLDETPYDAGRSTPSYPNVFGEVDVLGHSNIRYADPDNPDKSFSEHIGYAGNFTSNEANGLKNELNLETRTYNSGGHSHNTDGQHALYGDSNLNIAFRQDIGHTAGGNQYQGAGEGIVSGTGGGGSFHNDDSGSTWKTSGGDYIHYFDGSVHQAADGDYVLATQGSKIDTITAEHQIYVSEGNMDTRVEAGKFQIYSGDSLTVNTNSTMTLSSTSTMNLISTAAMNANTQDTMSLQSQSTMTANSQGDMKLNSLSSITANCGIAKLEMTPSNAKVSVGPIASIEMNSGSITIMCGASIIEMTAAGIVITTPSLTVESVGESTINSAGPMTVTSDSEAVFGAAGQVQLASSGTAAVMAPLVFIGL